MGRLRRFFRYKVFVDALFHSEVMSIFNLPIDNRYFTLLEFYLVLYAYVCFSKMDRIAQNFDREKSDEFDD